MTDELLVWANALAGPLTRPESRTWWPGLVVAFALAAWIERGDLRRATTSLGLRWSPSTRLDLQLTLVNALPALLPLGQVTLATALARQGVRALDATFGQPGLAAPPGWLLVPALSLIWFVLGDLSRFLVHRAFHQLPALWALHAVHHSAETLNPLTFHRVHPLERALMSLRGALVGALLGGLSWWLWREQAVLFTLAGVQGLGLVANLVHGNLRHSHVWLRYPPWLERLLLSPAHHQLHHAADRLLQNQHFGTWLSVWDRLAGTFQPAPERPPAQFGLGVGGDPDHDLGRALLRPLRRWAGLALLLPGASAAGQEPAASPEVAEEIEVTATRVLPHVAGSAYVFDEEALERTDARDIHRVLAQVPGVYVRQEDGFGLRPNIGLRGGSSDRSARVTLLEDGLPLAPAPYAGPAAYYFPLMARITGVEVYKGAASVRFGPQNIGGVINLKTRPVPTGPAGEASLGVGRFGSETAHLWAGTGGALGGVLLEVAHGGSDGFKQLDTGGPTGFTRQDVMLKAQLGRGPVSADLKLGWGQERSFETYLGLSPDDFAADPYRRYAASQLDQMDWDRWQGSLGARWEGERLSLRAVAYQHALDRAWNKLNRFNGGVDLATLLASEGSGQAAVYQDILRGVEDSSTPDQWLQVGTNDRQLTNRGVALLAEHLAQGPGFSSQLELGLRFHSDHVRRLHDEVPYAMRDGSLERADGPRTVLLDADTTAQAWAAHAHQDLELASFFHLVPGLRMEAVKTGALVASPTESGRPETAEQVLLLPALGALAELGRTLDLFGGLHRGASPTPPGEDLPPETAWNLEAGARLHTPALAAELVGFRSDYRNLYGVCTASGGCSPDLVDTTYAAGQVLVLGAEALLTGVLALPGRQALGGEASLTLTDSAFQSDFVSAFPQWGEVQAGYRLPYVPPYQGAGRVWWEPEGAGLSFGGVFRGPQRDVASDGPVTDGVYAPASLLLDSSGFVSLVPGLKARATATNLLGAQVVESWRPMGARPAAPFTFWFSLEASLEGARQGAPFQR